MTSQPLEVRQRNVGPWQMNTYALVCPTTQSSVLIDPGDDPDILQEMLAGKAPNILGDQLQGLAKAANITAPPPEDPAAPPAAADGVIAAPAPGSASGQGLSPSATTPTSGTGGSPSGQGQAPAVPLSGLQRFANLPLPILLGIAFGLAVLSAILTALLIF